MSEFSEREWDVLRSGAEDDPTSVHTFVPVPAEQRPRRRRRTARILLIDHAERVLLFADTDPGLPGSRWWMTPGGGIDDGESEAAAAVRELAEETGLAVGERDLVGPVLRRRVIHGYTDVVIDQQDVFFACWVPAFEVSDAGRTPEERLTLLRHRWWGRAELAETDEEIWPADLRALWDEADVRLGELRAGLAPRDPLVGGTVEESTVPS